MSATQRIAAVSESGTAAVGTRARDGRPVVEPPVLGGAEHTDYYLLDDMEFVKEFRRMVWLKRIEFIRLDVGNSEQLPVSSRTLIDDNIGFERGK